MGFEKGNTFGRGRPKGSQNKNSIELRQMITDFLTENLPRMMKRFSKLDDNKQWQIVNEPQKYATPQLKAIDHEINVLSDEQFEKIVAKIKDDLNINQENNL